MTYQQFAIVKDSSSQKVSSQKVVAIEIDLNPGEGALPGVVINLPETPEAVTANFDLEAKKARVYIKFQRTKP